MIEREELAREYDSLGHDYAIVSAVLRTLPAGPTCWGCGCSYDGPGLCGYCDDDRVDDREEAQQ